VGDRADARTGAADSESMSRVGDDAGNICEDLLGIQMTGAGYGWATAGMAVPHGVDEHDPLPPELLCTLADVAVGRSLLTTIAPPGGCRTAQLHVDITGVPIVSAQTLTARGDMVSRDDELGLSVATICDAAGSLLLRASGWLAVVPSPGDSLPSQTDRSRPVAAGLADLRALLRPRTQESGTDCVLSAIPEMANRFDIMHGGMQLSLLLSALTAHGEDTIGPRPRLLSVDAVLHRPAPVNHAVLTASCRVVRAGRRVLTVDGELIGPSGKALVTATAVFSV